MLSPLLDSLPASLIAWRTRRTLTQDQILYRRGEPSESIFFVEYGRVRLDSRDAEGRTVPLYVVRSQECVSEGALFAELYCSDVIAEVRSTVQCFPKQRMLDALQQSPEFSRQYMAGMARRFNLLRTRLELRNLRSARERVLRYFISLTTASCSKVLLDRPMKNIAEEIGLSPECMYRALALLASQGILTRDKRTVSLHGFCEETWSRTYPNRFEESSRFESSQTYGPKKMSENT